VNEQAEKVLYLAEYASLDIIQLHGEESTNYWERLKGNGFQIIKAFGVGQEFDPRETDAYSEVCDYFLFDKRHGQYGGTGSKFDWELLIDHSFAKPFIRNGFS
jgi:phosphoribosylanthranilate isomerase